MPFQQKSNMPAREEGLCVFTEIIDGETGETVSEDKLISGKIIK